MSGIRVKTFLEESWDFAARISGFLLIHECQNLGLFFLVLIYHLYLRK
jgi:hypothetical protein